MVRGIGYRRSPKWTRDFSGPYIPLEKATGNAAWTLPDIVRLVNFLERHVGADGVKFKPAQYRDAADDLNQHIVVGGPKKDSSVKDKLREVRLTFPTCCRALTHSCSWCTSTRPCPI